MSTLDDYPLFALIAHSSSIAGNLRSTKSKMEYYNRFRSFLIQISYAKQGRIEFQGSKPGEMFLFRGSLLPRQPPPSRNHYILARHRAWRSAANRVPAGSPLFLHGSGSVKDSRLHPLANNAPLRSIPLIYRC